MKIATLLNPPPVRDALVVKEQLLTMDALILGVEKQYLQYFGNNKDVVGRALIRNPANVPKLKW